MPNYKFDRAKCVRVLPKEKCSNCGWSTDNPYYFLGKGEDGKETYSPAEPHEVIPEPVKASDIKARCANCGASYNMDKVACASCGFEPVSDEMWEKLRVEKNAYRKKQFLNILPPKAAPVQVNMAKGPIGLAQPSDK